MKQPIIMGLIAGMSSIAHPCYSMNYHENISPIPPNIETAILRRTHNPIKKYFQHNPHHINEILPHGGSPLTKIISSNDFKLMHWLLTRGADANIIPQESNLSPLMIVAGKKQSKKKGIEISLTLLKHGARINEQNALGETAFTIAAIKSSAPGLITFLLEQGADTSIQNRWGSTAIDLGTTYNPRPYMKTYFRQLASYQNALHKEITVNTPTLLLTLQRMISLYLCNERPQYKKKNEKKNQKNNQDVKIEIEKK